jgi:cytochrome c oxidase cbb3-type subunit 1
MYSIPMISLHFWITTIGVVLYIAAMWIAGVMEGLMWRAMNPDGTLTYAFVEVVKATYPYYFVRLVGGFTVFCGMLLMAWNVWMTIANGRAVEARIPLPAPAHA